MCRLLLVLVLVLITTSCERSSNFYSLADKTPPMLTLVLGNDSPGDPCNSLMESRSDVATRLTPFSLCAYDPDVGSFTSGLDKVCIKVGKEFAVLPGPEDSCWKEKADIFPTLLLTEGINRVTTFATDKDGNVSRAQGQINFNLSDPPKINLLHPTSAEIIAGVWNEGATKQIEYQITDDDTQVSDIKIFVSLAEQGASQNFKHLGCNFANSPLWKQCPASELENSSQFVPLDSSGRGSFNLTIPSGWGAPKIYSVVVTAIDKSGNAAVLSTQEINVKHEVLAGRSYRGLGGSPTRYQIQTEGSYLAYDRSGSLYVTSEKIKVDAFDRRTCRLFRSSSSDIQAFDCPDALVMEYALQDGQWAYDAVQNVFYAVGKKTVEGVIRTYLLELDFARAAVTPILGGEGKLNLVTPLPADALSLDYETADLQQHLFFDQKFGRVLFRTSRQIFSIDRSRRLVHVVGSLAGTTPVVVNNVMLKDMIIPSEPYPFSVSEDGRLFIAAGPDAGWNKGSGYGVHYILEADNLLNASERGSFRRLTPELSTPLREPKYSYVRGTSYDRRENRIFASLAWWSISSLKLPPKGSDLAAYEWVSIINDDSSRPNDNLLIGDRPLSVNFPFSYSIQPQGIVYAGNNVIVASGDVSGAVISVDVDHGLIERLVGYASVNVGTVQLGMNMKVDFPASVCVGGDGNLYFNDYGGLNRITPDNSGGGQHVVELLRNDIKLYPFRCDTSTNKLYQMQGAKIGIYDLANITIAPETKTDNSSPYYYDVQLGLSNSFSSLKRVFTSGQYDRQAGVVFKGFISTAEFGSGAASTSRAILTNPDLYAKNVNYCNGACSQGPLVMGPPNYYSGADYRVPGRGTLIANRITMGIMAYDSTDTNIYGCWNNSFTKYDSATGRFIPFTVRAGTTALGCSDVTTVLVQYQGKIYFSRSTGIYELDVSLVNTQNKAAATLVPIQGAYPAGIYSDFVMTPTQIILTDRTSERVIRVWR